MTKSELITVLSEHHKPLSVGLVMKIILLDAVAKHLLPTRPVRKPKTGKTAHA